MKTVVLLSGGLDSTVALFWARERWADVSAMSVDYKQKHARELVAARAVAALAGVALEQKELRFPWPPMCGPVLPGRNGVLLHIAGIHAGSRAGGDGARVVIGACAADAAGFVDCRPEYLLAKQCELSLALACPMEIVAPFVDRTKAQIVREARRLNAWDAVAVSWSCYVGGDAPCGLCGACGYRAQGFAEAGEVDPWK